MILIAEYFPLRHLVFVVVAVVELTFTCSKSAIETLEKGVKYVQS